MKGRAEISQHTSLLITYFSSSPWLQQSDSKRCGMSSRLWLGESPVTFLADLVWEELRIPGTPRVPLVGTWPSSPILVIPAAGGEISRTRERFPGVFWRVWLLGQSQAIHAWSTWVDLPVLAHRSKRNHWVLLAGPSAREKWGEQSGGKKHKKTGVKGLQDERLTGGAWNEMFPQQPSPTPLLQSKLSLDITE